MALEKRAVPTFVGCFSSHLPLTDQGYYKYQSSGWCNGVCTEKEAPVLGLSNGTLCWCGIELPPLYSKVSKSNCDTPCQGYNQEDCGGGTGFFTVWLTGIRSHVAYYNPDGANSASSYAISSSATSHSAPTKATSSTLKTTKSNLAASASATSSSNGDHASNSAASSSHTKTNDNHDRVLGIALGVVLGVLALAILAVVLWLVRRRRRRTGDYFRNRTPSPESSITSEVREIDKPGLNNFPNGSTELPTSENNRESGVLGNSQLPLPVFMNPSLRQSSQATSYEQPFYTPAEQSSFSFAGSAEEEPEVPTQPTSQPPSLAPVSMPPPELEDASPGASMQPPNPFSGSANVQDVGLGYMSTEDEGGQRDSSILHHYPSASEVDRFDFSAPGQRMSQVRDQ